MTTLAALASATTRVRLGVLVTGVTYRHPSLFASQAVTIDHASHGRLEVSLGAAWFEPEHHALGFDFPPTGARFDRLEDALEVLTRLLSGRQSSYEGRTVTLREAQLLPRPVQLPHPPIWIGGSGPTRTLPLAARFADVWHSFGSPARFVESSRRVDELAERAGRDPASITRAASLSLSDPLDVVRRNVDAWRDVGVGYLVCGWPAEGDELVVPFAEALLA